MSTPALRTAQAHVACVYVQCPHCEGPIDGPVSGSHYWDRADCEYAVSVDRGIRCEQGCPALRVPRAVIRLAS